MNIKIILCVSTIGCISKDKNDTGSGDKGHIDPGGHDTGYDPTFYIDEDFLTKIEGEQEGSVTGQYAGGLGDINEDGFQDIIIGAPGKDVGEEEDVGAAYILSGSSDGSLDGKMSLSTQVEISGEKGDGALGRGSAVSDIDHDGAKDILLYADIDGGRSVIYRINASPSVSATVSIDNELMTTERYISSIGSVGDHNEDGWSESAFITAGVVYLIQELETSMDGIESRITMENAYETISVSNMGDTNGDGGDDLLVGAWLGDNDSSYLFYASISDLKVQSDADVYISGENDGDGFGFASAGPADLNGDGYNDLVISAPGQDQDGAQDSGAVYIFYCPLEELESVDKADGVILGKWSELGSYFGLFHGISVVGDIDLDERDDLLVGQMSFALESNHPAYLLSGPLEGTTYLPAGVQLTVRDSWASIGPEVAGVGDVNGGGVPDLLFGDMSMDFLYGGGGAWLVAGEDLAGLLAE